MADRERRALEEQIRQLQETLNRVQTLSNQYWNVLDPPCRAMDQRAWFGPKGREFGTSAHSDRADVRAELSKAVKNAERKVADLRRRLADLGGGR